jgi:hypothetical protein
MIRKKLAIPSAVMLVIAVLVLACTPLPVAGQEFPNLDKKTAEEVLPKKPYSPKVNESYPTRVFWGDTHLHTSQSRDAVLFGTTLGPDEAYRFARGEEVISSTGQRVQLNRPLDFLVVADHSENFGRMSAVLAGDPELMSDPVVRRWHELMNQGPEGGLKVYGEVAVEYVGKGRPLPGVLNNPDTYLSFWLRNTGLAEKYNDPGRFTTLIGYEWSSNTGGNNLHPVVIFRTNRELTGTHIGTLGFGSRSLGHYSSECDDLFIPSNAASASSGRARTTKSSVRFTHRTFPDESIRNSAGREMSAPSRRPCACTRSHLRITSSCASERIGKV